MLRKNWPARILLAASVFCASREDNARAQVANFGPSLLEGASPSTQQFAAPPTYSLATPNSAPYTMPNADAPFFAPLAAYSKPPAPRDPAAPEFPPLPPNPYEDKEKPLTPLDQELYYHGGSQLYQPEGDHLNWDATAGRTAPFQLLRLPETYEQPQPFTLFAPFVGSDLLPIYPNAVWPGKIGYYWDPRFVMYGSNSVFAFGLEQNHKQQDAVGDQLVLEFDLRLTGTERFHVQYHPYGKNGTGGSYYQFNTPTSFVNNATLSPDRYWFEGELQSMSGGNLDPFFTDVHMVVGRFPFTLHNNILMNADMTGGTVSKNTIVLGNLSGLDVVAFGGNNLRALNNSEIAAYGFHSQAEYKLIFFESTIAGVKNEVNSTQDQYHAAFSATKFLGTTSLTGRAMFKFGDQGGTGEGQLYVIETNHTHDFIHDPLGIDYGVFYCNAFHVTSGWNGIASSTFNRLSTSFETNPLVRIAAKGSGYNNTGIALGVQLFRHHEDESWVPEIAFDSPGGSAVFGVGGRYLRKTGARSYLEVLGIYNGSHNSTFNRAGVFVTQNFIF